MIGGRESAAEEVPSLQPEIAPDPAATGKHTPEGPATSDVAVGGIKYYPVEILSKRPHLLREPDFDRPEIRESRATGKTRLLLWISPSGAVARVFPEAGSLPEELVRPVTLAFEKALYSPGELDGVPVGTVLRIEVDFSGGPLLVPGE